MESEAISKAIDAVWKIESPKLIAALARTFVYTSALGLVSAGRNTFALLSDKADLALRGVVVRVRHQLDPANAQVAYLNGLVESAVLDPGDRAQAGNDQRPRRLCYSAAVHNLPVDRSSECIRVRQL